jgi:hypothetical protein
LNVVAMADPNETALSKLAKKMLAMPPKKHKDMKLGKRKAKASTKPSQGVPSGARKSKRRSK